MKKPLSHHFGRFILKMIAGLPLPVLYFAGDLLRILVYSCFGYRKKIVKKNLRMAFPNLSETELLSIEKKFYRNLFDQIVETLKLLNANEEKIVKIYEYDPHLYLRGHNEKKNIFLLVPHQFNWEIAGWILSKEVPGQVRVIYTPIKNRFFSDIILELRSKTGARFYIPSETPQMLLDSQDNSSIIVLAADQSPGNLSKVRWGAFLGKYAPFHKGLEDLPGKFGGLVVVVELIKLKRGKYRANTHLLSDDPQSTKEGELTQLYIDFIEKSICRQPENYLWTHRRWKHSDKYPG